jgi:hypothetical protein
MTGSSKPPQRSKARKRAHRATATDPADGSAASSAPGEPCTASPIDAASLDEAFVKALEADFIAHGAKAIAALRNDKPTDYVKIVATLRAKDAGGAADPLREMTDAELDRHIEELARRAGFEIRPAVGVGREDAARDEGTDAD